MKLIKPKTSLKNILPKEYSQKRNNILFMRRCGGLGDILMHCMMFEDIKKMDPDIKITFACPKYYMCIPELHRYIDKVVNVAYVEPSEYAISYDTTSACLRYEVKKAPYSDKHRSDIWANHCGVELNNHNINLDLPQQYIDYGRKRVEEINQGRPTILLCPYSADKGKDFLERHITAMVDHIKNLGFSVFYMHYNPTDFIRSLNIPMVFGVTLLEWMGVIQATDYVISVDTGSFHYAGAIGKPMMAMFTFTDGKVYGKYYKNFVLIQHHRDDGHWDCGPCYNYPYCTKRKYDRNIPESENIKPCLTEITDKMLISGIDSMLEKYPINTILN